MNYGADDPIMTTVVKLIILFKENNKPHILLLKRSSNVSSPGMEDLPGGKMDENENFPEAIARELWEETQLSVNEVHSFSFH